jgi:hypothetical protein
MDFVLRNNMPKKANKYQYLLNYLTENNSPIFIYLDYQDSSLPKFLHKKILIRAEAYMWSFFKGFPLSQVSILDAPDMVKSDDVFFSFLLKNLDTEYH